MSDPLPEKFAALGHPVRLAMVQRLARGARTVGELAAPFDMTPPAISNHLKVLERAGLIERGREAQWRPCRLQAAPLKQVDEWVEAYRRHWEERLDRLDDYLRELQSSKEQPITEEEN